MIDLKIDTHELERLALDLAGTEKEVQCALRSTLSKMSAWLRTRTSRTLSQELRLKYSTVRHRIKAIRFKQSANGGAGGVWIGLNPLDLKFVGVPVQNERGVTLRGRASFPHAFLGPRPGVKASKLNGNAFKRTGKDRLPIEKMGLEVKADADQAIESKAMDFAAFEKQFYKTFEHELKWQTQKRK